MTGRLRAWAALNRSMLGSKVLMSSHDVTETVSSSDPDGESSDMSRSKPTKYKNEPWRVIINNVAF